MKSLDICLYALLLSLFIVVWLWRQVYTQKMSLQARRASSDEKLIRNRDDEKG